MGLSGPMQLDPRQVTPILNKALERTGDGFAADRNTQEFLDVPTGHWAFLHIAEAADPVEDEGGGMIPVWIPRRLGLRGGPDRAGHRHRRPAAAGGPRHQL